MKKSIIGGLMIILLMGALAPAPVIADEPDGILAPDDYPALDECIALIEDIRAHQDPDLPLHEVYRDLPVIDIHNHDAASVSRHLIRRYDEYNIDSVVLFGEGSNYVATLHDFLAFDYYRQYPDRIFPNFAGVPIHDDDVEVGFPEGTHPLDITRANLEKGYYGIGEIVGSSLYSPYQRNKEWKAEHPNDGYLPEIYALAAEYRVSVLLHIDPPTGLPIARLEDALYKNPDTIIIFAHVNAYNPASNAVPLLAKHDNLYFDFYAGFTIYNSGSEHTLESYTDWMEEYPDRFFISTDSGAEIAYVQAVSAMYETIDVLTPATACKVAYLNYFQIIEAQPPTETMLARVDELAAQLGETHSTAGLNKRAVHTLIFELEARVDKLAAGD